MFEVIVKRVSNGEVLAGVGGIPTWEEVEKILREQGQEIVSELNCAIVIQRMGGGL